MATVTQKRKAVVSAIKARVGKNTYTQSANRLKVGSGYGDCSSTTRYAYLTGAGFDIGLNTEAQIKSSKGKTVKLSIVGGVPDESKMKIGDCLYFRGDNNARYKGVGHVEMYIGDGKLCGHGSGKGPTIKDMKTYCKQRYNTKSTSLLKNKGLIEVRRFLHSTETTSTTTKKTETTTSKKTSSSSSSTYTVKKGDTLSSIAKKYSTTVAKLQKLNNISNTNKIKIGQKIKLK